MLQLSKENSEAFNKFFNELLDAENILPFHKTKVTPTLLGKLNDALGEKELTPVEMMRLEQIFDFVEEE